MNSYLDKIIEQTASTVAIDKQKIPLQELKSYLSDLNETKGFYESIKARHDDGLVSVIAEIKKASPSQGLIRENFNPEDIAKSYQASQATCLSVLTDAPYFKGSLEDLAAVREVVELPLLRKDFIVDEYQIYESKLINADAILLIASILNIDQLKLYSEIAYSLDLDVIIEVHNELELDQVLKIDPKIIGINNRDLSTFKVDLNTTLNMINKIPVSVIKISESGIYTSDDMSKLYQFGCNAVLIGESIITSINPYEKIKELRDYD